jgi:two-component system, sensor histidine kinase and response regulator
MPDKILIIDDDRKFSFGLMAVLQRTGYEVETASTGRDGLEVIRSMKPDLILCDIMMPAPNGIMLKQELMKDPQLQMIPFLFVSARISIVDKLAGLKSGADDYIEKPFHVDELLARIEAVVRRDELGRQRGIQDAEKSLEDLRISIATHFSHELRTPLTALLTTLDLVIRKKFTESDDELSAYIETASSSAHRINFLIQDLEMLHAIDQGTINTYRQVVDPYFHIRVPVNHVLKTWEHRKLKLRFEMHPDTVIYGPRYEFGHVVAHLVDNACKFSPKFGKVRVDIQPYGSGGCFLEVMDEGTGIPPAYWEKVFTRFYQISQGDTREYGGLGVGLTIARAFARGMGGDVTFLDSPFGCRVQMVLPPFDLD